MFTPYKCGEVTSELIRKRVLLMTSPTDNVQRKKLK